MATPTSASARAGASLIPSPVMMTAARRCSRRTASSLASGVSSASTSSTPVSAPTALAASARSPVASTIRVMPPRRSARIVCRASGRIRSSSRSAPAGVPSTATNTVSAPSSQARRRTALTHGGVPLTPAQSARPSLTRRPATVPAMPWPGCSVTSAGWPSVQPRSAAARTTAVARTCPEAWSSEAARPRISSGSSAPAGTTAVTAGWPAVSVPVLSSSTVVHRARRSSTPPFFTTIPRRAAADRPETRATGAARMSGQGVATTRTATARAAPPSAHATPATARLSGRNHRAYRSASRTNGACVLSASLTRRTMPA